MIQGRLVNKAKKTRVLSETQRRTRLNQAGECSIRVFPKRVGGIATKRREERLQGVTRLQAVDTGLIQAAQSCKALLLFSLCSFSFSLPEAAVFLGTPRGSPDFTNRLCRDRHFNKKQNAEQQHEVNLLLAKRWEAWVISQS